MVAKQILIMEEAVKLFAEKGYYATSVQEIVEKCEIAKGSFYHYFQSKEELLISIFKYYHELISASVFALEENPHLNSKEKFMKQLYVQIEAMTKHTVFIQMFIREQMLGISKELDEFLNQMEKESICWFQEKVIALFPELPKEYYADCTLLLDILFKGYLATLIRVPSAFDKNSLPEFIYNRLKSIVVGFEKTKDFLLDSPPICNCMISRNPKKEIEGILKQIMQAEKDPSRRLDVYRVIQQEILKENPNAIILESLVLMIERDEEKTFFTQRLIDAINQYKTAL